ncbi:hypothetical protein LTR66_016554, partial [Elasticomyces elasticus]
KAKRERQDSAISFLNGYGSSVKGRFGLRGGASPDESDESDLPSHDDSSESEITVKPDLRNLDQQTFDPATLRDLELPELYMTAS